jgi:hypothetical protein
MLMAKKIELAPDLKFTSIVQARTYFKNILNSTALNQRVSDGEFESLRLLYQAYCAKTNWPVNSSPKAFFPKYEQREGFTTKCFGVEFVDGTNGIFSLDKALSAVAN